MSNNMKGSGGSDLQDEVVTVLKAFKEKDMFRWGEGSLEFTASGPLANAPVPGIVLSDGSLLRFPVVEQDLQTWLSVFEQSRFGKGEETVLDVTFRNSWELKSKDFKIQNPEWDVYVQNTVVNKVLNNFKIRPPVVASLYKLLLYRKNSFFKPHRDTEKENRMFATLVIQLPSKFEGGQLVVRHDGEEKKLDFSTALGQEARQFSSFFAAFYCDCEHEILPLTDGIRVCLIYNLAFSGAGRGIPRAPCLSKPEAKLVELMKNWEGKAPDKFVYILVHQYSPANLSFENLKSSDVFIVDTLRSIAEEQGLIIMLGILDKQVHRAGDGNGDYFGWKKRSRGFYLSDDHEDHQIMDNLNMRENGKADSSDDGEEFVSAAYDISNFIVSEVDDKISNEKPYASGRLIVGRNEVIPFDRRSNMILLEKNMTATGNEGVATWWHYKHAVLLVFHKSNVIDLFCENKGDPCRYHYHWFPYANLVAENLLLTKVRKFQANLGDSEIREDLLHWIASIRALGISSFEEIYEVALQLKDKEVFSKFLANHDYAMVDDNVDLLASFLSKMDEYGWNDIAEQLVRAINVTENPTSSGLGWFGRVKWSNMRKEYENASKFVAAFETMHHQNQSHASNDKKQRAQQLLQVLLNGIQSSKLIREQEHHRLLMKIWTVAELFDLDVFELSTSCPFPVVVEGLLHLAAGTQNVLQEKWRKIAKYFLDTLSAITSFEIQDPSYIRKDFKPCHIEYKRADKCQDCLEMKKFMAKEEISASFRIKKTRRDHLILRMSKAKDISYEIETKGSPHALVVTKKPTSEYVENKAKRALAIDLLSKLQAVLPP